MRESLYELVVSKPTGVHAVELLTEVLEGPVSDTEFGRMLVGRLLAADPRFKHDSAGSWFAVVPDPYSRLCLETEFVVVDLETTGNRGKEAEVTELGAVRMRGTREIARMESLTDPGLSIPPYVAKLTGITDEMVAGQPSFEEVFREFVSFSSGAVLVAHDASFDAEVLDRACRKWLGRPLGLPSLCTLRLARRLLPGARKLSLDALAEHFVVDGGRRHRAMADAELTAGILAKLLELTEAGNDTTLGELLVGQHEPSSARPKRVAVTQQSLERLTTGRGVYRLLDGDGRDLYIARADDVQEAVVSLLFEFEHYSERMLAMVSAVRDVECEEAGSELDARIREARMVRALEPAYNRNDRHLPSGHFIKITMRDDFPRVFPTGRVGEAGSLYLGPLRSRRLAERSAEVLARMFKMRTCPGRLSPDPSFVACELGPAGHCSRPCDGAVTVNEYRRQARDLERCLRGTGDELRSMAGGGSERRTLERLYRAGSVAGILVNSHSYICAVPSDDGGLFAVLVVGGRYRASFRLSDISGLERIDEALGASQPPRQRRGVESDSSTVMAHWMNDEGDGLVVTLDEADLAASWQGQRGDLEAVLAGR